MTVNPTFPVRSRGRKKKWLHKRDRILELAKDPKLSFQDIANVTGVPKTTVRDYVEEAKNDLSRPARDGEGGSAISDAASIPAPEAGGIGTSEEKR